MVAMSETDDRLNRAVAGDRRLIVPRLPSSPKTIFNYESPGRPLECHLHSLRSPAPASPAEEPDGASQARDRARCRTRISIYTPGKDVRYPSYQVSLTCPSILYVLDSLYTVVSHF